MIAGILAQAFTALVWIAVTIFLLCMGWHFIRWGDREERLFGRVMSAGGVLAGLATVLHVARWL